MATRDEARRHWGLIAAGALPDDTVAWLQSVARQMLGADELPDGNARHLTIVEASGLKHRATPRSPDGWTLVWVLRDLQTLHERNPDGARTLDPLDWIAARMGWDDGANVAPDSIEKRIRRQLRSVEGLDDATRAAFDAMLIRLR